MRTGSTNLELTCVSLRLPPSPVLSDVGAKSPLCLILVIVIPSLLCNWDLFSFLEMVCRSGEYSYKIITIVFFLNIGYKKIC